MVRWATTYHQRKASQNNLFCHPGYVRRIGTTLTFSYQVHHGLWDLESLKSR
ncbi:hypothetical protein BDV11DRAFT_200807 [Aspergillus similis]